MHGQGPDAQAPPRHAERRRRDPEEADQPRDAQPGPRPFGVRGQGRHPEGRPDRVHLERHRGRHVHHDERREAGLAAPEPRGGPHHRHRGAPTEDPAAPGRSGARRSRRHPRRVPPDERHLRDDGGAAGRVGDRGSVPLRLDGADRRQADVGEADRTLSVSRSRTLLRPSVRPPGSPSGREIAPCESS